MMSFKGCWEWVFPVFPICCMLMLRKHFDAITYIRTHMYAYDHIDLYGLTKLQLDNIHASFHAVGVHICEKSILVVTKYTVIIINFGFCVVFGHLWAQLYYWYNVQLVEKSKECFKDRQAWLSLTWLLSMVTVVRTAHDLFILSDVSMFLIKN